MALLDGGNGATASPYFQAVSQPRVRRSLGGEFETGQRRASTSPGSLGAAGVSTTPLHSAHGQRRTLAQQLQSVKKTAMEFVRGNASSRGNVGCSRYSNGVRDQERIPRSALLRL